MGYTHDSETDFDVMRAGLNLRFGSYQVLSQMSCMRGVNWTPLSDSTVCMR